MKTRDAEYLAHIRGNVATLAVCWLIEKRDGTFIRGTDHDADLDIPATGNSPDDHIGGRYLASSNITASDVRSSADGAVDNMNVDGAVSDGTTRVDVSVSDIEAGLLTQAPVTLFLVNWQRPADGIDIARYGYLGEITRDSDGLYQVELRSLKQLLAQTFVRTYSERCQVARFGDSECGYDLVAATITGTVTAVTNAKRFDASLATDSPAPAGSYFDGGELTFTTGPNAGYMRELKRGDNGGVLGNLSTWERFPEDPQVGDAFTLTPGCDRLPATCKAYGRFALGWRGYGIYIAGLDALMRGPT